MNDTLGHAAGDDALIETAHRLRAWRQPGWICGRLGGDEFTVICPNIPPYELSELAAKLNHALADIPVGTLKVSASIGHASASEIVACTADALMAAADAAMFVCKAAHHSAARNFRDGQR